MNARLWLLSVVLIGGLAGCSAAEQEKALTTERKAIDRFSRDAQATANKSTKELQNLRKDTMSSMQRLHQTTIKGVTTLTEATESGARAVERGARGVEQLSQDAAKNAASVRESLRRTERTDRSTEAHENGR